MIARSKVTAEGQTFHEGGEKSVVRRARRYTSEDIHRALFPKRFPRARSVKEMKAGVRAYVKRRPAGV